MLLARAKCQIEPSRWLTEAAGEWLAGVKTVVPERCSAGPPALWPLAFYHVSPRGFPSTSPFRLSMLQIWLVRLIGWLIGCVCHHGCWHCLRLSRDWQCLSCISMPVAASVNNPFLCRGLSWAAVELKSPDQPSEVPEEVETLGIAHYRPLSQHDSSPGSLKASCLVPCALHCALRLSLPLLPGIPSQATCAFTSLGR